MNQYNGLEIAIIGMSGQFPGAGNVQEFWNNLRDGKESISFFSKEELEQEGIPAQLLQDPRYVRANAYIDNKEYFDASFFGYLPAEARLMDPQMRLFHENCWKALEDAGYNVETNTDKIGLFAGGSPNTNWVSHSYLTNLDSAVNNFAAFHLRDITYLCTRVSYLLNLQGPSIYLNTACSTSLVAVQRACMSLLLRECRMALAGGVTINNFSKKGYLHEEGMIFSKDGHCRAFDAAASGTVGGEGVGVVVLKRLQDAVADRDHIYAVIKGSGINNDGSGKMAYTAPGVEGQRQAIMKALSMANVPPESIGYVEAHGTGTKLGDPVEVEALNSAYGASAESYCALGAVKTNIGHLDSAAGIAGLIKAVLAIRHRQIPPSLHFSMANEAINFRNSPFYVNARLEDWHNERFPLRAGVSSFGIGGTNVHVILEEAPTPEAGSKSRTQQLLVISGKTAGALERNKAQLLSYLQNNRDTDLADIACTLQTGRVAFPWRESIVCGDREEAISLLGSSSGKQITITSKETPPVVFMFSGQGSQYAGMCSDLYQQEPVFRRAADNCLAIARQLSGRDVQTVLFTTSEHADGNINDTIHTQPALFIIEYALAKLLMHWGIQPSLMIGHSIGEYVAACLSGVLSLENALRLVIKRGELMQSAPRGRMLAVSISEAALQPLLLQWEDLSLAAVNSPELCVIAGTEERVGLFEKAMEEAGIHCKKLHTSHAFHSWMMDGILEEFTATLNHIQFQSPGIPYLSNLTGREVSSEDLSDPGYWVRHLRQTVQFSAGIEHILLQHQQAVLIELGPGRSLSTLVRSHKNRQREQVVVSLVRANGVAGNDLHHLLRALGQLWEHNIVPAWPAFYEAEKRNRVALPTYDFERTAFPVHVDAFKTIMERTAVARPVSQSWLYLPSWKKQALPANKKSRKYSLILGDNRGIGQALAQQLEREGTKTIVLQPGPSFLKKDARSYELDPSHEEDYSRLMSSLAAGEGIPYRFIHCWSLDEVVDDRLREESSFYSLQYLVKALSDTGAIAGREFVYVTNDLYAITGMEQLNPAASKSLGLLKVIPQEYPMLTTSHIDISLTAGKGSVVGNLLAAIHQAAPGRVVAVRGTHQWVQEFDAIEPFEPHLNNPCRAGGVYLVTGGLGNLGYTIARELLTRYKARVVLTGRTVLPPVDEWDVEIAKADTSDPIRKKIGRLQTLHAISPTRKVLYLPGDIAHKEVLEQLLTRCEEEFGPVNGIIHTAGIVQGSSINAINQLQRADFEAQFMPKIKGLVNLQEVAGKADLDFCLIVSSLSSVLGGLGFGAYASANSFCDHYVQCYNEQHGLTNWTSVNLDGLTFTEATHHHDITVPEIWPVIEKVLACRLQPQVIVSKTALQPRLADWLYRQPDDENGRTDSRWPGSVPGDKQGEAGREAVVRALWEDFFGRQDIGDADDFFEAGGDSLKALTMIGRLSKTFQVEIPVSEFFKRPTIAGVAACLNELQKEVGIAPAGFSIPQAPVQDCYPLSAVQRRLYFLHTLNSSSLVYNIPQILKLEGRLDKEKLEAAFAALVMRHDSLRTYFEIASGEPVQTVAGSVVPVIEYFGSEEDIDTILRRFIRPFELARAPLIRMGIAAIGQDEHLLLTDLHHIVTDGVSFSVLIGDFMALYNRESLLPLALQYKDYAVWQQDAQWQLLTARQRAFWLNEFAEPPTVADLPADHPRPLVKTYAGHTVEFEIDAAVTARLREIAAGEGATLFMVALSVYGVFTGRLCNQEDIVIGTPASGRLQADLEKIIGMFVNTLCIRSYPRGDMTFLEYLQTVKEKTLACFDNQAYQYDKLVEDLKLPRDTGRNPLFESMFVFRNFELTELTIPGLQVRPYPFEQPVSRFDLTLSATEKEGRLLMSFEYSTDLFGRATIERFIQYFHHIIAAVVKDPLVCLGDIEILTGSEKEQLLHRFNDTRVDHPNTTGVLALFEQQVVKTPEAIAVIDGDAQISYRQLNAWANHLAVEVRQVMPAAKQVIGLLFDPCVEMIAGMLAILKLGCAYLPLSPQSSAQRNQYILADAGAALLLCAKNKEAAIYDRVLVVEKTQEPREGLSAGACNTTPDDLVYVIYTSGSTGQPKGVAVTHEGLLNTLYAHQTLFNVRPGMHMSQVANVSFDASAFEIWPSLANGCCLHIAPAAVRPDPALMKSWLCDHQIELCFQLPAIAEHLLKMDWEPGSTALKVMNVAGDRLNYNGRQSLPFRLFNLYGPTEDAIWTTWSEIRPGATSAHYSIGRPIDNKSVYILNKYHQLQPVGMAGELYISGKGLARGYVNNEPLTREKFVDNPFVPGEKMYKSGDHARWLSTGEIEFLGRLDAQVKIRGYRIEPGEIESHLLAHPQVKEAVVIPVEMSGEKWLVAYYTMTVEEAARPDLKQFLSGVLPAYMVPAYFVLMDNLPLTVNGKLDRNSLPAPAITADADFAAPATATEELLTDIWSEVLQLDREVISTGKSFFELGGHSLKATILVNKIMKAFEVAVPLQDVFTMDTIARIADYIDNEKWIKEKNRKELVSEQTFYID